jgi:signal transduction histidine kinase
VQVEVPRGIEVAVPVEELGWVLTNLLTNACEAIDAGCPDRHRIVIRGSISGRYAVLSVSDTGAGIAESELPRVFDLFLTSKGERGKGIGLWAARKILASRGATIEASSRIGRGTTMTIRLPLAAR